MIVDFLKFISENYGNFALGIIMMCFIYMCVSKISNIKLITITKISNTANKEKQGEQGED